MTDRPRPSDGWVYEHIVAALPGRPMPPRRAIALQFVGFEAVVLVLAWYYGLPDAAWAGTAAVVVATAGSAAMVTISRAVRAAGPAPAYREWLFGSRVEVVLGVVAYAALSAVLVSGVASEGTGLLETVLGESPPVPALFVAFLLAWDVCYRIGVGWWASVVGCWRTLTTRSDAAAAAAYRRADLATVGFAAVQLVLVPVVAAEGLLAVAVVGHVAAVAIVSGASLAVLRRRRISRPGSP